MSSHHVLSHISSIRDMLPSKPYVINVCQDRYTFLVGLAAALCRNHTTLLPPNLSPGILQELLNHYPACYSMTDSQEQVEGLEGITLNLDSEPDHAPMENPQFSDSHVAVIAFTSGTTGTPRPNPKTWGSMVQIAIKTGERLALSQNEPVTIVATVPHQHMYGLETSIMLPLQYGWSIHSGRPFFPEDIASVLHEQQGQRILVSTPIHLRACVMAQSQFPDVAYTLSATAPLPKHLAQQVETMCHTTMVEIYGFAEAGTIATRRPTQEDRWTVLHELALLSHADGYAVSTPYFSDPVPIPDTIQSANSQQFTLKGRPSHLINIGGHRASLDDLNVKLLSIDGVVDGVFYMPEEREGAVTRLVAFVVAPGKTVESLLATLRQKISPVFLPRPMYLVEALPRNHTGKLVKEDAETLIRAQSSLLEDTERVKQSMIMNTQIIIDPSHPSLAGHFPGNPIMPGVVILEEILKHIGESLDQSFKLSHVPSVKFHSPLRPNERLELTFDVLPDHLVTFSCQVGSRQIASGQFIFEATNEDAPPRS